MNKKLFTIVISGLILSGCAELTNEMNNLGKILSGAGMPSYEFYEKFSETDNANVVLPILEKNLVTVQEEWGRENVFKFSPSLVNQTTFNWFSAGDDNQFNNKVGYLKEVENNKVKWIGLRFSHVLTLSKSNFYKIFDLKQSEIDITQLKQHCSEYRRIVPMYKLSIKNGKSLYFVENYGSGSAGSQTDLYIFKKLPSCRSLGYEKTVKAYGNEMFN